MRATTRIMFTMHMARQESSCILCGTPLSWQDATVEHLVPLSRLLLTGGMDALVLQEKNITLAHKRCNDEKGDQLPTKEQLARHRRWYGE